MRSKNSSTPADAALFGEPKAFWLEIFCNVRVHYATTLALIQLVRDAPSVPRSKDIFGFSKLAFEKATNGMVQLRVSGKSARVVFRP